jgi:hypothetical protein
VFRLRGDVDQMLRISRQERRRGSHGL